jgi:hypothetical protein
MSWEVMHSTTENIYRVGFAGGKQGWALADGGVLLRMGEDPRQWSTLPSGDGVAPSCLAFDPAGSGFGLAPLWKGSVLQTTNGVNWTETKLDLEYSMPDAIVVDAGWAYILGTNGRLAHYVDANVKEK